MENETIIAIGAAQEDIRCGDNVTVIMDPVTGHTKMRKTLQSDVKLDGVALYNPRTPRKLHYLHGHAGEAVDCKICVE